VNASSPESRTTSARVMLPEPIARMDDEQRRALRSLLGYWRVTFQDSKIFLELALTNVNALIQEVQSLETLLSSGAGTPGTGGHQERQNTKSRAPRLVSKSSSGQMASGDATPGQR